MAAKCVSERGFVVATRTTASLSHFAVTLFGVPAANVQSAFGTHWPYSSTVFEAALHSKHHGVSASPEPDDEKSLRCAALGYSHTVQDAPHKHGRPVSVLPSRHNPGAPGYGSAVDVGLDTVGCNVGARVGGRAAAEEDGVRGGLVAGGRFVAVLAAGGASPVAQRLPNLPLPVGIPLALMQLAASMQSPLAAR